MSNKHLNQANLNNKNEFYTQFETILHEICAYHKHFENKVIFCPCNDFNSQFRQYFYLNFHNFKLKKLICMEYIDRQARLFEENPPKPRIYIYDGKKEIVNDLETDGDFRIFESIEYLKACDIVVTNPPFSHAKELIRYMLSYEKDFIILANQLVISDPKILEAFGSGLIRLGHSIHGSDVEFSVPKDYDDSGYCRVTGIRWFTTLNHNKQTPYLQLVEPEKEYLIYDNYKAINCNRTKEIPDLLDVDFGVPISYIDYHDPNRFDIIGILLKPLIQNQPLFSRLIIRRKD